MKAWIGVDLDGTLATYDEWRGAGHIGEPVPAMVERVFRWLRQGKVVKVLTARVSEPSQADIARAAIDRWCTQVFGQTLPVVCCKDYGMVELWDDRAVQVEKNTGRRVGPEPTGEVTP